MSIFSPQGDFFVYDKRVQSNSTMFVDPRYGDEAISALMEEALSEDSEETKFDVEKFINGEITCPFSLCVFSAIGVEHAQTKSVPLRLPKAVGFQGRSNTDFVATGAKTTSATVRI